MANREVLISALHEGERLVISTPEKTSLCGLWGKRRCNNRRMPGWVRHIWITYPNKNCHHSKLLERKQLLRHVASQAVRMAHTPLGTGTYNKSGTFGSTLKDPHHREDQKKRVSGMPREPMW